MERKFFSFVSALLLLLLFCHRYHHLVHRPLSADIISQLIRFLLCSIVTITICFHQPPTTTTIIITSVHYNYYFNNNNYYYDQSFNHSFVPLFSLFWISWMKPIPILIQTNNADDRVSFLYDLFIGEKEEGKGGSIGESFASALLQWYCWVSLLTHTHTCPVRIALQSTFSNNLNHRFL